MKLLRLPTAPSSANRRAAAVCCDPRGIARLDPPAARRGWPLDRAAGLDRRSGLGRSSWVALVSIALAVAALSLSRMQVYAVYANERDAVRTLRQLADRLEALPPVAAPSPDAPAPVLRTVAGDDFDPAGNARWSADGTLLRRNGYLFRIGPDALGNLRFAAWPFEHAETGQAAYTLDRSGVLMAHRNDDGRYSGPAGSPAGESTGWIEVTAALQTY